jgi:BASS family bile acid:Na+ symporter
LAVVYFVAGMLFSWGRPLPDHLSSIIAFGIMNNVLVLVLSSQFFSPIEATVAAMYTIPFFALIVPLRLYQNWARRQGAP